MKQLFQSYTAFTRTERFGLLGLCALIILLIVARIMIPNCMHTEMNTYEQKRQITAWEVFRRSQPVIKTSALLPDSTADYLDASDQNDPPLPASININTADSAILVRLKGIGPAMAGKIVVRRNNKGAFTDIEQLLELQYLPPPTFAILKRHLTVK